MAIANSLQMAITRGHHFKVIGGRYRGRFFTQRVVGVWNARPAVVVESDTLGTFKRFLDRHMDDSKMKDVQVSPISE